ncbi:MAG: DUF1080 domain-containing protein [Pirellulaceae bacterium]|nr:DUF1080 domain-containing protein [Pirellulaceae bacterium]
MTRLLSRRPLVAIVALVLLVGTVGSLWAAPPDARKYAITDISKVDDDFAYQGEYVGRLYEPRYGYVHVGFQVVARGDGKFDAVLYEGGLPGAGWNMETKTPLSGTLRDGTLVLEGDGRSVTTDGISATIFDSSGSRLGYMQEIHRVSPTIGANPPRNAIVLFDGESTENLEGAKVTEDGLLEVGVTTKMPVQDFRLHLEFRTPYMPYATGQSRGNSGVYIQRRYEVQILDSFGLEGVHNECGGLYRQQPPDVNMCLPPLSWQTYDIWFTPVQWDDEGNKIANARLTVRHNGVAIHSDRELTNKTGAGKPEGPDPLPILLQNHGNPVHFRNFWISMGEEDLREYRKSRFPRLRRLLRRLFSRLHCCRRR